MTETARKEEVKRLPGTTVPWEQILSEVGPIPGNEALVKSEWEKLDAFAYIYLWWWVHR